jgi:quercetin dioxygenase-like cupin family protein
MGPVDGADLCQGEHLFMLVTSGRLAVQMEDGAQMEYGPGDVGSVPPGHESWVVGDETVVAIGFDPAA